MYPSLGFDQSRYVVEILQNCLQCLFWHFLLDELGAKRGYRPGTEWEGSANPICCFSLQTAAKASSGFAVDLKVVFSPLLFMDCVHFDIFRDFSYFHL